MQSKSAVLLVTSRKTCFVSLPVSWTSGLIRDCVHVYEVHNAQNTLYASWAGDVHSDDQTHQGNPVIELNGLFAVKQGFSDGQEVLVTPVASVPSCSQVFVEPVSVDDWEILEIHASFIESNLLNQLRAVCKDQIFPVWVQKSICIFIKISSLVPASKCCLLDEQTEVIISPKQRSVGKSNGSPAKSVQSPATRKSLGQPAGASHPIAEGNKECVSDLMDRQHTKFESAAALREQNPRIETEDMIDLPNRDLFQRTFDFFKSLWHSSPTELHTRLEAKPGSYDLEREILGHNIDASFRIQPFMHLDHHLEEACNSSFGLGKKILNDKEMTKTNQLSKSDIKKVNFVIQPTNVYITECTLKKCLPKVCQDSIHLPSSFIAVVSKLPSPVERHDALKNKMGRATAETKHQDGGALSEKDILEEPQTKFTPLILRVVVLDVNHNFSLKNAGDLELARVEFSTQSKPLDGHVMIPDLLRRQVGFDVTGQIRLQNANKVNPVEVNELVLHPLFELPKDLTQDMLVAAFKIWLADVSCSLCPLVTSQGTLIKYFLKQAFYGEFLLTFISKQSPPSGDAKSPNPLFCLLTREMCEHVKITVSKQVSTSSLPECLSHLPAWSLEDIDPRVPAVLKSQLECVDDLINAAVKHLEICVAQRILASRVFSANCGLHHGGVLVSGSRGTGKTVLSRAICRQMASPPNLAHVSVVECKPLRGKRLETIRKKLTQIFNEAAWRQPAVILLDDLDQITPAPTGPEQEMSGEAVYFAKVAEILKDLICKEKRTNSRIGLIVTCKSRSSLHHTLVTSHGHHFFPINIEIKPPDKLQRPDILKSLILSKPSVLASTIDKVNLGDVSAKTEGYVARDLDTVVDRAIHAHLMLNESNEAEFELTAADFQAALQGFSPAALRNVSLHQAGNVSWEDVGGLHDIRHTLVETLQYPSKFPELFASCPLRLRSGLLLYGAPGTGKTLLAGVVARECGLNFISIKGPELLSKYIGASEQAVRDTFERAQSAKPCILFFDEFDSLAPRRGHDSTGVTDRVVNQLLTQLDGVEGLEGVYVMAATSRPDLIDPALLRPGRLDKALHCPMPDCDERLEILKASTRKMNLGGDVDLNVIASDAEYFTGADFKALLYNAQLEAIHAVHSIPCLMSQNSATSQNGWDVIRSTDNLQQYSPETENNSQILVHSPGSNSKVRHSSSSSDQFQLVPPPEMTRSTGSDQFQMIPGGINSSSDLQSERTSRQELDSDTNGIGVEESCRHSDQNVSHSYAVSPEGIPTEEEKAIVAVKIKSSSKSNITFIPKLEDGPVDITEEKEQEILSKLNLIKQDHAQIVQMQNYCEEAPIATATQIKQCHLEKALNSMGPSVSERERYKYTKIYENFMVSRGGNFSEITPSPGKRATLA